MAKKSSNHNKHGGGGFFGSSFDRTVASFLDFMFFEHLSEEEKKEDYSWRRSLYDTAIVYGINPYSYEREEDFIDALAVAQGKKARENRLAALSAEEKDVVKAYSITVESYSIAGLKERISNLLSWRKALPLNTWNLANELGINPYDFIKEADFQEALSLDLLWRKDVSDEDKLIAFELGVDIEDYAYEDDFFHDLEIAREEAESESESEFDEVDECDEDEESTFEWSLVVDDPTRLSNEKKANALGIAYDDFIEFEAIAASLGVKENPSFDQQQYNDFILSLSRQKQELKTIEKTDSQKYRREAAHDLLQVKFSDYEYIDNPIKWRTDVHKYEVILGIAPLEYNDKFIEPWDTSEVLKASLYQKYNTAYPQLFVANWFKDGFAAIGKRASSKAITKHLPLEMFIYLSNLLKDTYDSNISDLLYHKGCKEYRDYMIGHVSQFCDLLSTTHYSKDDLDSITDIPSLLFLDGNKSAICEALSIYEALLIHNNTKDNLPILAHGVTTILDTIRYYCYYIINEETVARLSSLCKKLPFSKSENKIYVSAFEKIALAQKLKAFTDLLLPSAKIKEAFFDADFKSEQEAIEELFDTTLWQAGHLPFVKLQKIYDDGNLTEQQQQLFEKGLALLPQLISKHDDTLLPDLFSYLKTDSSLKKIILSQQENDFTLSQLCSYAIEHSESKGLEYYLDTFFENYSQPSSITTLINSLTEGLGIRHSIYGMEYSIAEKTLSERELIYSLLNTKEPLSVPKFRATLAQYKDDIDRKQHELQWEKDRKEQECLDKQIEKELKSILGKIDNGKEWVNIATMPKTITFQFPYPCGKHGDINMFLAREYGVVRQSDPLFYEVEMPTTAKEQLLLMCMTGYSPALHRIKSEQNISADRKQLEDFLITHNLFFRLQYLFNQYSKYTSQLYNKAYKAERNYQKEITAKRETIYQELAARGMTSAKWVSEQQAYSIIKALYPDAIYQFKADWLGSQSIDVYIPCLRIGIEYQGAQHYIPVSLFGGEDGLKERIKRDQRKKKLCAANGVTLIEWKYSDPLTEEFIREKISSTSR